MKLVVKNDDVAAPKHWSERCTICGTGKYFLSLKSLFNHYNRHHPEKEAGDSGSRNGGYKPKKLRPVWPGNWTRTAKRSEKNYSLIRARMEIKQAAITLMDIYNLEIENRKLKASSSRLPEEGISPMKKIRPQKRKTTRDNSSSYSPEAQFKCPICYKAFTSYQAMGGHRSSHNKPKNLVLNINSNVGRGNAFGGGHKRSHWGDANQYDQEIHQGSYLEGSQLKKMKNAHDEEMEHQHEEEQEVEDQEEDGDGASDWVYSDGTTTSTPFATSSSS